MFLNFKLISGGSFGICGNRPESEDVLSCSHLSCVACSRRMKAVQVDEIAPQVILKLHDCDDREKGIWTVQTSS